MKIAIVNSFFPPWRGGAESYVNGLAHGLKALGNDVTILCADVPLSPGTSIEAGVTVKRHRLMGRVYGTPIMPGLIRDLLTVNADIFHANFPSPYIASLTAWASKTREIPAVLTWHNDLPPVTSFANLLIRVHDKGILPKYIHAYRRIIATTPTYARESPILSSLGQSLTIIPNGVNCHRFSPKIDGRKLRAKLGVKNRFTILFVGALTKWHRYKGLDVLLRSMRLVLDNHEDSMLIVVGEGELRGEYQAACRQLKVSTSTLFLGDVPEAQLPGYYAASDLLVMPSKDKSEGFGLTALEANAMEKPVVASNVGGVPSVVRHNYNGLLVPPNDPLALSEAILHIRRNRHAALRMGRNGRKVAEEHDWKNIAALTENAYVQALETSR